MLNKLVKGQPDWTDPLNENVDVISAMHNRLYDGVNLTVLHAIEIQSAHGGDPWAWIAARIKAGNFEGILVGDYIPLTAAGNNYKADIAGINTYKNYGDLPETIVGNHIDFITRECHPDPFMFNRANYNNGTTVRHSPYLASDIHARLNNLQKSVPNATTASPAMVNADYRSNGILGTLPQELRNVIVQKRNILPSRFTAGQLLVNDVSWAWGDMGLLWLPFETEIYGNAIWGSNLAPNQGLEGGFVQYPLFAENMKRVKTVGETDVRTAWWLGSAGGGNSTAFAYVNSHGSAPGTTGASTAVRVPLCFRIA